MGSRSENGPYNLLSLDGGGIRGVSELVILDTIMREIQKREGLEELPKPCDYFHLIGGTSTGGLIAIMLGRLRMSTTEALAEYNSFAEKIFRKKNRRVSVSSQFRETTLETVIKEVAKKYCPSSPEEEGSSDLMRDPKGTTQWSGRAFVCARPSKNQDRGPIRLRAYPSGDEWDKDVTIWEAARATSAAPLYFKSISITSGSVTEEFIDPALGCNNPTAEVVDEAGEIFDPACKLGCVLSLGTGTRPKNLVKARGVGRNLQLFMLLKDYTTDSERTHAEMLKRFTDFPSTYFRFSVPNAAAKIGMAKYKMIPQLKRMTEGYLESPEVTAKINEVVEILREKKTEGVTIGHARYPDKTQIIIDNKRANTGGIASRMFTGRTEILDKLSAYFSKREGNLGPRREFLMYGMGGMGKTQIALKFKQMVESEKRFSRVLFVDATDSATIEESYNEIAAFLPVSADVGGTGTKRVLHWMSTTSEEWLLIMDNRNDDDQPITRFLPSTDKGNILYTARPSYLKQTLPEESVVEVDKMEEQEAITMLLKSAHQDANSPNLRKLCLPIIQELGYLPLAIDHAGAYINMTNCSIPDYLPLFLKNRDSMLRGGQFPGANNHNIPVYATFDLSYKVLQRYARGKRGLAAAEKAKIAIKILSFICFYHDQGIMEDTVKRAAENRTAFEIPLGPLGGGLDDVLQAEKGKEWNSEPFRDAVRLLESLSIVKTTVLPRDRLRTISMHVLVHSWARDRMDPKDRVSAYLRARSILYDSVDFDLVPQSHLYRRRVAPHLRTCDSLCDERCDDTAENRYLARRAAVAKDVSGPEETIALWEEMVRERKFLKGPDSDCVLQFSSQLAVAYMDAGRWFEAEALFVEILERGKMVLPPTHELLNEVHGKLSELYTHIGLIDEAVEHLRIRIEIIKEEADPKKIVHVPELLENYQDLVKYRDQPIDPMPNGIIWEVEQGEGEQGEGKQGGESKQEESKDEESLSETELWEQYEEDLYIHGPDGQETLNTLQKLASKMHQENRQTCAWILAETYVRRCKQRYGPLHRLVRSGLNTQARAYMNNGLGRKAREVQRENLELHRAQCGTDSRHTIKAFRLLSFWEEYLGHLHRIIEDYMANNRKTDLSRALEVMIQGFKKSFFQSTCHTLPCGQTSHAELITRLGIEERYPQGVLVTPEDIGVPEIGLEVEHLFRRDK